MRGPMAGPGDLGYVAIMTNISRWLMGFLTITILSPWGPDHAQAQVSQNFLKEEQPRYELGAGFLLLNVPDFPGSDNNRLRFLPFPYGIYRGKYLRADDEGTRARLFSSKFHETSVSGSFNFPVRSGNNPRRLGMPDLPALAGFGPRFLFRLLGDDTYERLNLSLALRVKASHDLKRHFRYEGFAIQPGLSYWKKFQSIESTLFSSLNFNFGTARLSQFFYQVAPDFATDDRPAFHAQAGLVQSSLLVGLGHNIQDNLFVFLSSSWRNLDLSSNRDSPLIATRNNIAVAFGLVWTFFESESKVLRIEDQILEAPTDLKNL